MKRAPQKLVHTEPSELLMDDLSHVDFCPSFLDSRSGFAGIFFFVTSYIRFAGREVISCRRKGEISLEKSALRETGCGLCGFWPPGDHFEPICPDRPC